MKVSMLAAATAVIAVAIPAQAHAGRLAGIVVAKQHGTLVVTGARGAGTTVLAAHARARAGDRVAISGTALRDGTVRASAVNVRSHARRALLRGVAMRHRARTTFLAVGRSIVAVHGPPISTGAQVDVRVRIDDDGELTELETHTSAPAGSVEIEGKVVSVAPFVVSLEGLPVTITVPAGTTLPAALTAGDKIELTVQASPGNVFTLVSIDELENAQDENQADEVEARGTVVASTAAMLSVLAHGTTFTFAAPAGVTLPVLPAGTFVEAKGVSVKGVLTLVRVKVEDDGDDDGGHGGHH